MSTSPDQMSQFCAPSYWSTPFPRIDSSPWNPTLPVQPILVLNQLPISQPASITP